MFSAAEILEQIEGRRLELGLSQNDLGLLAFGKADNTAIQNLKKGSAPAVERLDAIARALDLELYFGPRRTPAAGPPVGEGDFAQIPLVDARLAAGGGAENGDSQVTDLLAFRRDWLKRLRVDPSNAVLARVTGNSMKPTLADGDTILIDTSASARQIAVRSRPPARGNTPIYALRTNEGERVKRLLRPDDETFILLSDNPEEAPEVYSGKELRRLELKIIGQVVWSGHIWR